MTTYKSYLFDVGSPVNATQRIDVDTRSNTIVATWSNPNNDLTCNEHDTPIKFDPANYAGENLRLLGKSDTAQSA